MKLNETILKAYATKKDKSELDNIIIITDNESIRNTLVTTVCTLYFENNNDFINKLKELIQKNIDKLKSMVFLPIMKKANNETFASQFNSTFLNIKIDVDAWKIRKRKSDNYYIQNEDELIKNINNFAIERDYFLTGIKELDEDEKININLDNTTILVNDLGTKKSLENLDFNNIELLNLNNHDKYKSKKIILINNNNKEDIITLLSYCFSLKVINISIMDKQSIVKQIKSIKEILPNWVSITDKGNYKFNEGLLARLYVNTYNLLKVKNQNEDEKVTFYEYIGGVYQKTSLDTIKAQLTAYIPDKCASSYFISNTIKTIQAFARTVLFDMLDKDVNIINFKNGIYNIKENKIYPHSPDILSTIQLNCNIGNKECKGDKWKKYLTTLCTDALTGKIDTEKIEHLQIWGGLLISNIPVSKAKACLCLFSKIGNTGKSVYLNVIKNLIGKQHISGIPLQQLSERFNLSGVYGKRVNIVGDQEATALHNSSIFKMFTGDDGLNVEFKGKTSFLAEFTTGLVFACNMLPYITDDKGTHIYDRLHIIPFNNVIPEEERNPNLLNELIEELDYIAQWYLIGLKKFIAYGYKIPRCTASSIAIETYRENNDHFYSYIINNYIITKDPKDRVAKTDFENNYYNWCDKEEIPEKAKLNKRTIKSVLLDNYNIPLGKNDGYWYYKGLRPILKTTIEQGKHIEKEVKEVFEQQIF